MIKQSYQHGTKRKNRKFDINTMAQSGNNNRYGIFTFLNTGMLFIIINIVIMAFEQQTPKFYLLVYLGILLWLLSVILWVSGLVALKKHGALTQTTNYMSTSQVVDSGVYRIFRHPQYTSFILFNMGIMLKIQTTLVLFVGIVAIVFIIIGMKEEEAKLLKKFGAAYRNYMKRVPL